MITISQLQVSFGKSDMIFGKLELSYGAELSGENLRIEANQVKLYSGSLINLVGSGFAAATGPGAGSTVSFFITSTRMWSIFQI